MVARGRQMVEGTDYRIPAEEGRHKETLRMVAESAARHMAVVMGEHHMVVGHSIRILAVEVAHPILAAAGRHIAVAAGRHIAVAEMHHIVVAVEQGIRRTGSASCQTS